MVAKHHRRRAAALRGLARGGAPRGAEGAKGEPARAPAAPSHQRRRARAETANTAASQPSAAPSSQTRRCEAVKRAHRHTPAGLRPAAAAGTRRGRPSARRRPRSCGASWCAATGWRGPTPPRTLSRPWREGRQTGRGRGWGWLLVCAVGSELVCSGWVDGSLYHQGFRVPWATAKQAAGARVGGSWRRRSAAAAHVRIESPRALPAGPERPAPHLNASTTASRCPAAARPLSTAMSSTTPYSGKLPRSCSRQLPSGPPGALPAPKAGV